jgi:probable rRNA maturation factor
MTGLDVVIEDDAWRQNLPHAEDLAASLFAAACARDASLKGDVALLLTDDEAVAELNRRFRRKTGTTNVLSFPSGEAAPAFIGDIALAYGCCSREAAEQGRALGDHAAHLIVHGLLHLAGYDHQNDNEAREMERLETEILDAIGVCDPYEGEEADR